MKSAIKLINEKIESEIKYRKELVEQIGILEDRMEELKGRVREIDKNKDEFLEAIKKLKG
ncbi:hypothetical protein [Amphibacillus xylanus]|uniref:Uncharacterized protein n=1 Tax=Amphibacillus xylanus (strain ATCC 51415 / DSM 6626 / JCM 7361 / LMG 17667 / NBRC 15112 / Ep01) TaxID=698758 RepID=K0J5U3_AMPXN|nr:hypothetical protein [Amphibacillus xylanus]BAM46338.1 hypothetical protein AXY_02060 [Amphibacillus xylanus NBRC 15112]